MITSIHREEIMRYILVISLMFLTSCTQQPQVCSPGVTQQCICPNGQVGSQSCDWDGRGWGYCYCSSPPVSHDAGVRSCSGSGTQVLNCGCWGSVTPGQTVTATGCCSGRAIPTPCFGVGYCDPYGQTVPWRNICQ